MLFQQAKIDLRQEILRSISDRFRIMLEIEVEADGVVVELGFIGAGGDESDAFFFY